MTDSAAKELTRSFAEQEAGEPSAPPLRLAADGRCLTRTLAGIDMPEPALDQVRSQALELLQKVVGAYETNVAVGEVGTDGSATASAGELSSESAPTGLLYGRIQSGKTLAMITFTAMAMDNGFRVVVVLTSNFVELVSQTAERFSAVAQALVHDSTGRGAWKDEIEHIKKHVGRHGLVVVCGKGPQALESVGEMLDGIGASGYPAIILDDEADQASLDANVRKRSLAESSEVVDPTKIHELINDIRTRLPHHVFLQVTATPYSLLLQRIDNPLRPKFTQLLEPGAGYTGGADFFSADRVDLEQKGLGAPPVVIVEEAESGYLETSEEDPPIGLQRAIATFLLAAAARHITDPTTAKQAQNFLCHTSHKMEQHERLANMIRRCLGRFEDELEHGGGWARQLFLWAEAELRTTAPDLPGLDELLEEVSQSLHNRRIRVINSEGKGTPEKPGSPNFIVGGNIVGRGLTIENLLVSYYFRKPKISQMDTMLQHARMYGYRSRLMPYTRVFLPWSLAIRFNGIHRAEEELRSLLAEGDDRYSIPVHVIGNLRPTRYGVLDANSVVALKGGQQVHPISPPLGLAKAKVKRLENVLHDCFGEHWAREAADQGEKLISVELACELVQLFQGPDWESRAYESVLSANAGQGQIYLQFRPMHRRPGTRQSIELPTGALSGREWNIAKKRSVPTFCLFRQNAEYELWQNELFWYPTLVFPETMPPQLYNNSSLA